MEDALAKKIEKVRFTIARPSADRVYHIAPEQVKVVLSRRPYEHWRMLRAVHFNDTSRGARVLGYVTGGRREVALAALPPRMSCTRFLGKGRTPEHFGAVRGTQWPELAIQRFLLYGVFLRELGYLQVVDEKAKSARRKYAREGKAQAFALHWRRALWDEPFDHPDPIHQRPSKKELAEVKARLGVEG